MQSAYPVDEGPVPTLSEEGKLLQDSTEEAVLENKSIGRRDDALVAEQLELAAAQRRDLMRSEGGRGATAPFHETLTRVAFATDIVGALVALVVGPSRLILPEAVVLVAVEVGTAKEQRHDDGRFEERSDSHGETWRRRFRVLFIVFRSVQLPAGVA